MEKFIKTYDVTSYECDANGRLRIRSLMNYFQDLADTHANVMGVGYHFCKELNIGWICGAYHIQINELPKWEDKIHIATWPSASTPVTGIRDFQMTDDTGRVLVNASSQWVLVDLERMRPVPVARHISSYELVDDHALQTTFPAIETVNTADTEILMPVRTDDIDINKHVNNAVYPTLGLDGLSSSFLESHTLAELQIAFKKPAVIADKILVKTHLDNQTSVHQLCNAEGTSDFARIKMIWR